MRPRIDGPSESIPFSLHLGPETGAGLRDAEAVADLFLGMFRRDLLAFLPQSRFEPVAGAPEFVLRHGPDFDLIEGDPDGEDFVEIYGVRHRLGLRDGGRFSAHELRLVRAIGAVLNLRYHHLFTTNSARLDLYRGGSEDHYVAAFLEPHVYVPAARTPSRIAATIQTLRTAALSTYENHRVSTGVLLIGNHVPASDPPIPTSSDALVYGVELTAFKSIHRLCDGERTLFLIDPAGRLAKIVDIGRWAASSPGSSTDDELCPRFYEAHARATRSGGHVCLVLSPNQEIKVFAQGVQAFAFTHGRWRLLNPLAKFAAWSSAVADSSLARRLFLAAMNLSEARRGALFVVIDDPDRAVGRLIAPGDRLTDEIPEGPPLEITPRDPLARRALHYLARGRTVDDLDPTVLEALASVDGALAVDRSGRLLAFGAILRHDASDLPNMAAAEGARTTAALAASRFGSVLKVSEDGVISCFLQGSRAWDL